MTKEIGCISALHFVLAMRTYRPSMLRLVFTYYPLALICMSTTLNSFTLVVLYQRLFRQRPTIRYMRAIAIIDMVMLYGWNFDHFLSLQYGFELDRLTVGTCKFFAFFNHFMAQSAAWLRVWMCADRWHSLNNVRQSRREVNRHCRVLLIIIITLFLIALINLHLPIFSCYSYANGTKVGLGSLYYRVYPMWNYVHLSLYNLLPFILMLFFNIRIIRQLIMLKRTTTVQQSRIQHSAISISILLSTFLFCLMTTPATILFAFFHPKLRTKIFRNILINLVDSIQYTYHSTSFFLYFITLVEFRSECFRLLQCCCCRSSINNLSQTISNTGRKRYQSRSIQIATITN